MGTPTEQTVYTHRYSANKEILHSHVVKTSIMKLCIHVLSIGISVTLNPFSTRTLNHILGLYTQLHEVHISITESVVTASDCIVSE